MLFCEFVLHERNQVHSHFHGKVQLISEINELDLTAQAEN
jgi:hypothetical protein